MSARRLSEAGLAALSAALADLGTVNCWRKKAEEGRDRRGVGVPVVDGRVQWGWSRAVLLRAWTRDHRASVRVRAGERAQVPDQVRVLGHRCDNPLCQRVHPEHVVPSSYAENRRECAARRELSGSPLVDPRGARRRAHELRDLARQDLALVAADLARLRALYGSS